MQRSFTSPFSRNTKYVGLFRGWAVGVSLFVVVVCLFLFSVLFWFVFCFGFCMFVCLVVVVVGF